MKPDKLNIFKSVWGPKNCTWNLFLIKSGSQICVTGNIKTKRIIMGTLFTITKTESILNNKTRDKHIYIHILSWVIKLNGIPKGATTEIITHVNLILRVPH